jgi:DNA-directed RNA polymerase subunit beta
VKGHNIPQPGVPESFKVLVRELQSLCLDVRVLDKDGNMIELKDDEDDDFTPTFNSVEYKSDDREIEDSGYSIEEIDEDKLDLDPGSDDDDYTDDMADGEEDYE